MLGGNGDDGSVDDLPARSQIAPIFQIAVEVLNQKDLEEAGFVTALSAAQYVIDS